MYTGEEKIDLSERPTSEFSGEAQDEGEVRPAGGAKNGRVKAKHRFWIILDAI